MIVGGSVLLNGNGSESGRYGDESAAAGSEKWWWWWPRWGILFVLLMVVGECTGLSGETDALTIAR